MISWLAIAAMLQGAAAPPPPPADPPILVAPPAPPPPRVPFPAPAHPSRARANLAQYVSDDDYPAEALFNDEQGWVSFRLYVAANGRVTGCTITRSSEAPSLDETTCSIMMRRARFIPATNAQGQPVDDVVSGRIRWSLQPDEPCQGEGCNPKSPPRPPQRARPIRPLASHLTHTDFPAEARTGQIPGVSRFRLDVAANGRVSACEITLTSGTPALDEAACRLMHDRARFRPARDAAGNAVPDQYRGHIGWREFETPPLRVPPSTAPPPRERQPS